MAAVDNGRALQAKVALITCSDLEPCDGGANDAGERVALGIGDRECVERGRATSGGALNHSDGAGKTGNYRWLATKINF